MVDATEDYAQEYWNAIEPVAETVDFYRGPKVFLSQYSRLEPAIGKMLAAHWCVLEVCNGGFHQLFFNSTGVLAPEAADAFEAFGMTQCASVVRCAMSRLGPRYPRRRALRMTRLHVAQMLFCKSSERLFDHEDDEFYGCYDKEAGGYERAGLRYLSSQRADE
jgi:hypothetical protein